MSDEKNTVWVAGLPNSYGYGEPIKYFGPSSTPIEIPEGLAHYLGAEIIDAPAPGVNGLEIEPMATAELVDVTKLKAALEQAQKDLANAKTASDELQGKYDVLAGEKTKWLEEKANLEGRNTTLQGEKLKLEAALEQAQKDLIAAKKK
jgi:hypothetical protein